MSLSELPVDIVLSTIYFGGAFLAMMALSVLEWTGKYRVEDDSAVALAIAAWPLSVCIFLLACCIVVGASLLKPTKKYRGNEEGFTLIEVLICICILGILSAVILSAYKENSTPPVGAREVSQSSSRHSVRDAAFTDCMAMATRGSQEYDDMPGIVKACSEYSKDLTATETSGEINVLP